MHQLIQMLQLLTNILVSVGAVIGILWAVIQIAIAVTSRRRITARFLNEKLEELESNVEVRFEFEATNHGDKRTALAPTIRMSALDGFTFPRWA